MINRKHIHNHSLLSSILGVANGNAAAHTARRNALLAIALAAYGRYVEIRNVRMAWKLIKEPAPKNVMRMMGTIQWTDE